MSQKPQIYLIDGSGYIFRAFHALPPLTRPDGVPVGAVLGFTNMLMKLLRDKNPDYLVVVFDAGRTNFRNKIYPAYKANREETPPELAPQFALIRDACAAFDVPSVEREGFEADDLIATYAHQLNGEVTIVSSDKDLMQLVTDSVRMLDPIKNRLIGVDEVIEKFGVPPSQVVDVQALAGDSSDNVPGVPGIGIKTAAELIQTYGSVENLLSHAAEIKQPKRRETLMTHQEEALISKRLVTLDAQVPDAQSLEAFAVKPLNLDKVIAFLKEQHFHTLLSRFEKDRVPVAPTTQYQLITDLTPWIQKAHERGYISFRTHGTVADAMEAELVGVSLSVGAGEAGYYPLGSLDVLKPILEDPGILKVGHDSKYDTVLLRRHGITLTPIDDVMVLSYILEGMAHRHTLPEMTQLYLNRPIMKYEDLVGAGRSAVTIDQVPPEKTMTYAAEEADVILQLHTLLKARLLEARQVTVYETLERPLIPVLACMEHRGVLVDAHVLATLSQDLARRLAEIEAHIYQTVGTSFNVGSPKQLGEVLFDTLKLPGGKKGKTGAYSTSAEVLESLSEQGFTIADSLLEWRQLSKLKSTYTDALPLQINPYTGRVHTSYAMTATSTGRLASSNPNLQNIPVRTEEGRKIRSAFVASPGMQLVSADYSQIELRLLAHMADIPSLQAAFWEGKDIHTQTAADVFGVPADQVTPELRYRAKAINFGIVYGISPFGLARQLGISRESAADHIQTYFKLYPGIQAYMESMKTQAREHGYVTTLLGRRCFIADIHSRDPNRRAFAERQAINAPLQGGNADILNAAMIKLAPLLPAGAHMLLQVHDEVIFEVADADIGSSLPLITKTLQTIVSLKVPLVVDVRTGQNWAAV